MILYFIRHAQSENNALLLATNSNAGRKDDPVLTPRGREQAGLLAAYLQNGYPAGGGAPGDGGDGGFGITHMYTSLMERAVQTGVIVASQLGLPLMGLEPLHEKGGMYLADAVTGLVHTTSGKSREYYQRVYPGLTLPKIEPDGWWGCRPFEEDAACRRRAVALLQGLFEEHQAESDRILLITHADFYNELMYTLLEIPRQPGLWFTIHNTGITRLDLKDGCKRFVYLNRTSHLPARLLSA